MTQHHTRRATLADADKVRSLTREAYSKWVQLIGREPKPMTADYNRAVSEHIIDLYEQNGDLLALIEVIPHDDHLLVENVAVRPDQQGNGLGDRMLQHAEGIARSMGFVEARLYTNALFASNLAFYKKRGYTEFARETLAPGAVVVHMRKALQ